MPCDLPPPSRPELPIALAGGCHCGAVRFKVSARSFQVTRCNCSICTMKGFLHLIVPREDFALERGSDQVTTYRFNTGVAQHHFCRTCGIHSYYVPRSHPDGVSVNARCLDDAPLDWFEIRDFDGQHWEARVQELR